MDQLVKPIHVLRKEMREALSEPLRADLRGFCFYPTQDTYFLRSSTGACQNSSHEPSATPRQARG